jgi:hypothetical protein
MNDNQSKYKKKYLKLKKINKYLQHENIKCTGHKNLQREKTYCMGQKFLKHKAENIPDDYPLIIEKYPICSKNINIQVVRDDLIPGGTKQRAWRAFEKVKEKEIVYAGSYNGIGQVVLGIIALKLNKCATAIMTKSNAPINNLAKEYGVNIITRPNGRYYELEDYAKKYAKNNKAFLMKFGFNSKEISDELIKRITESTKNVIDRFFKHTIWLTAGSGTFLKVLYTVFPNSIFNVVQVGKELDRELIKRPRINVFISKEQYYDIANIQPPYKSSSAYDAKLWTFVMQHAKNNDIIWNVAGFEDINYIIESENKYDKEILELYRKNMKNTPKEIIMTYPLTKILKYYNKTIYTDNPDINHVVFSGKYSKSMKFLNSIPKYFNIHHHMKCYSNEKSQSPYNLYKDKRETLNELVSYDELREFNKNSCTILYFTRILVLLKELVGDKQDIKYFDVSVGWASKLIAAILFGVSEYYAYELYSNLKKSYKKIIKYFYENKLFNIYNTQQSNNFNLEKYKIIYKKIENDYPNENELYDHFDICISVIVFHKYENYENYKNEYNTIDEWLTSYLYPTFKKVLYFMKIHGYICWHLQKIDYEYISKLMDYINLLPNCKYYGKYGFLINDSQEIRYFYIWQKI